MGNDQSRADKLDAKMLELLLPESAVESLGEWLADPERGPATKAAVVRRGATMHSEYMAVRSQNAGSSKNTGLTLRSSPLRPVAR